MKKKPIIIIWYMAEKIDKRVDAVDVNMQPLV